MIFFEDISYDCVSVRYIDIANNPLGPPCITVYDIQCGFTLHHFAQYQPQWRSRQRVGLIILRSQVRALLEAVKLFWFDIIYLL